MNSEITLVDVERKTWRHRIRMAWVITATFVILQLAVTATFIFQVVVGKVVETTVLEQLRWMAGFDMTLIISFIGLKVWEGWSPTASL